MKDFNWSSNEKKFARNLFDLAYKREIEELKRTVFEKATQIQSDEDIWELHNFLTERRDEIDEKYNYRYSRLIVVFGILLREKYIFENELDGLDKEKVQVIKSIGET